MEDCALWLKLERNDFINWLLIDLIIVIYYYQAVLKAP